MKRLLPVVLFTCLAACSSTGGPRPTTVQIIGPPDEIWLAANSAALSVGARIRHSDQRTRLLVAQLFMDSVGARVEIEMHLIDGPDGGRLEIRALIPGRDLPYSDDVNAELEALQEKLAAASQAMTGQSHSRSMSGISHHNTGSPVSVFQEVS